VESVRELMKIVESGRYSCLDITEILPPAPHVKQGTAV
jgi:hypothetical protein